MHCKLSGKLCMLASGRNLTPSMTYRSQVLHSREHRIQLLYSLSSSPSSLTTILRARVGKGKQRYNTPHIQLPITDLTSPLTPTITANFLSTLSKTQVEDNYFPGKRTVSLRPYIYAFLFFIGGSLAGNYVCAIVMPPSSPAPGTPEDNAMIKYLHDQAEKLPLVQSLRSDTLWTCIDPYSRMDFDIAENKKNDKMTEVMDKETEDTLRRRMTTGPLGGSRALGGYHKMFRNVDTGEIIKIIWFGAAISGWPGVTHGGILATVMDEALGRCAIGFLRQMAVTADLQINYLKPVLTNGFYVIRAKKLTEDEDEDDKNETPDHERKRKQWVTGTLETTTGVTCVKAKALFVVPRKYTLQYKIP